MWKLLASRPSGGASGLLFSAGDCGGRLFPSGIEDLSLGIASAPDFVGRKRGDYCDLSIQPHVQAGELEVSVLDVTQGDSILVISPKGSTLLIDGGGAFEGFREGEEHSGPDPGEEAVSAYLWSRGFNWMLWP